MHALLMMIMLDAAAQSAVPTPQWGQPVKNERQGGPLGLGVAMGAPSGLSTKVWFGDWMAAQFSVGGDMGWLGDLAVTGDYVFHFRPLNTNNPEYSVPLYVGAGVNLSTNTLLLQDSIWFGIRAVFGATVLVRALPVDLYLESAPTVYVIDEPTWGIDGQMGVRYYF
jgi:hypothetical protein